MVLSSTNFSMVLGYCYLLLCHNNYGTTMIWSSSTILSSTAVQTTVNTVSCTDGLIRAIDTVLNHTPCGISIIQTKHTNIHVSQNHTWRMPPVPRYYIKLQLVPALSILCSMVLSPSYSFLHNLLPNTMTPK